MAITAYNIMENTLYHSFIKHTSGWWEGNDSNVTQLFRLGSEDSDPTLDSCSHAPRLNEELCVRRVRGEVTIGVHTIHMTEGQLTVGELCVREHTLM